MFVGPSWPTGSHGHLQEFGTAHRGPQPFMRPAWDANKHQVLATISEEAWKSWPRLPSASPGRRRRGSSAAHRGGIWGADHGDRPACLDACRGHDQRSRRRQSHPSGRAAAGIAHAGRHLPADQRQSRSYDDGTLGLSAPRVQIDAWATEYDQARSLADAILKRLDAFRGDMAGTQVQGAFFANERGGYEGEPQLYRVSRDFFIWFEED